MKRILPGLVAAALTAALAAPTVDAATPRSGTWVNSSQTNGAAFTTKGRSIRYLAIYCKGMSYELKDWIAVRRDGSFSYDGESRRWGHEHQWRGNFTIRVSGRFVSSTRVHLSRRTPGCGSSSLTVRRIR